MTASISALGAAGGDKANYCQSNVSAESKTEGYYQNSGKDPAGTWQGNGLEAVGLEAGQTVTDEDFANILRGRDMQGNNLVQGAGDFHRGGWDITFSAPKSVSVLMAIADETMRNKILEAQASASSGALKVLEQYAAFGRRGKAGNEFEKLPGFISAAYEHIDSRELDPQLHTHVLVMNLAQRADSTWGGIESRQLYKLQHAAGASYRAELAKNLKELGFEIERDGDFFQIKGVPKDLCDSMSTRRQQIVEALEKAGIQPGSAKSSEIATLSTRAKKTVEITRDKLFQIWQELAKKFGFDAEKINQLSTTKTIERNSELTQILDSQVVLEPEPTIFDQLTSHNSVFEERDLLKAAAIKAQHEGTGIEGAKKIMDDALANSEIYKLSDDFMTTLSMLKIESTMIRQAQTLVTRSNHAVPSHTVTHALSKFIKERGFELNEEQVLAVREITSAGDLKIVQGAAGAGKSTMAQAAKMAWEAEGFKVIGAALSGKAASGLQDGSGIESKTIHKTLFEVESGNLVIDDKTVLVIDEAGMVGSRQMQKLTELAESTGAKLVLIGDQRQLQAIDAGGAFRALQNQMPNFSRLDNVLRQKGADKDASNAVANGQGQRALKSYIERGLVKVGKTVDETRALVIQEWAKDQRSNENKIMLAGTRNDVFELNQAARETMKLGKGHKVTTVHGEREFAVNDRIVITQNNSKLGIMNGQFGTVQSIKFDNDGQLEMSFKIDSQTKLVTVKITGENAFDQINHGYASTVHKSQGATVQSAYFYSSQMTNKELGYVAMSRHKEVCQVFTSLTKLQNEIDKTQAHSTQKMKDLVKTIALEKGIDIESIDIEDFRDARDFLNEHYAKWAEREETWETLQALGKTLEKSQLKETTLDHITIEQSEHLTKDHSEQKVDLAPEAELEIVRNHEEEIVIQELDYEIEY